MEAPSNAFDLDIAELLSMLPSTCEKSILKYHQKKDQINSLIGKLLLRKLSLEVNHYNDFLDLKIDCKTGRPFLSDYIDFNISHSDNLVACALTINAKVGIDVELIRSIDFSEFNEVFNIEEMKEVNRDSFFKLWTRKESALKAIGLGFALDPKKINCSLSSNSIYVSEVSSDTWWFYKIVHSERYSGTICSNQCNAELKNIKYTISELMV
jgi:4'-phosphopantetheinyl transferase